MQNIDYTYVCDLPSFRVQWVDAMVWDWIKELMGDPEALAHGLSDYQAEQNQAKKPLQERLSVVDDLLADNRRQLVRLLDLYLSSDFDKSLLVERKTRLERIIGGSGRREGNASCIFGSENPHPRADSEHL